MHSLQIQRPKLLKKRKQVLDGLKDSYGVSEKEVLASIGKASITNITADDLLTIIGTVQAIKDGETTVKESFKSSKKVEKTVEEVKKEKKDHKNPTLLP